MIIFKLQNPSQHHWCLWQFTEYYWRISVISEFFFVCGVKGLTPHRFNELVADLFDGETDGTSARPKNWAKSGRTKSTSRKGFISVQVKNFSIRHIMICRNQFNAQVRLIAQAGVPLDSPLGQSSSATDLDIFWYLDVQVYPCLECQLFRVLFIVILLYEIISINWIGQLEIYNTTGWYQRFLGKFCIWSHMYFDIYIYTHTYTHV